ncbi:MAG: hypothetical protein JWM10_4139 [Myxococcaceae bacterium]|nr:hypothetical protein [Myxococcaceae bacterium]
MSDVLRPVWRTYDPRFEANAIAHARAGGHAVVRAEARWWLLLPSDEGMIPELTAWAMLDLGVGGFDEVESGPAAGLLKVMLPKRLREHVMDWCERDAEHPAPLVAEALDCRACAMCCRKNRVLLEADDEARWAEAGRAELSTEAFVRESNGRRTLRVLRGGDCVHLVGNDCGIYALRPDNCRAFPAGSEGCLGARAEVR